MKIELGALPSSSTASINDERQINSNQTVIDVPSFVTFGDAPISFEQSVEFSETKEFLTKEESKKIHNAFWKSRTAERF